MNMFSMPVCQMNDLIDDTFICLFSFISFQGCRVFVVVYYSCPRNSLVDINDDILLVSGSSFCLTLSNATFLINIGMLIISWHQPHMLFSVL